ncbi:MAG: hypothetical protein DRP63_03905 [Planctomycetota bacterium]|nr:MAG: hypothetical protein DRP63_03905 [Planctomycetota bacterium]
MRVRVEREERVERIVIDLAAGRVRLEGIMPEPLLDMPLDKALLEAVREWLSAQESVKELRDEQA